MDPSGTIVILLVTALMTSGIKSGKLHYIHVYWYLYCQNAAQEDEFRVASSCVCPGCELVVECTITDGGATVWQGTIFDGCQNERITLRHYAFTSGIVIQESCGTRGSVVGRSVSVAGGSYTSQLLVNITEELNGKTIECANESGHIFGSKQIYTPLLSGACMELY